MTTTSASVLPSSTSLSVPTHSSRPHSYHTSGGAISATDQNPTATTDDNDNDANDDDDEESLMHLPDEQVHPHTPLSKHQLQHFSYYSDSGSDNNNNNNANANATGAAPQFTIVTNVGTPKHLSSLLASAMEVVTLEAPSSPSPAGTPETSPWIGGTGLGATGLGKSGRVIERLMAENDRLRREMKAEIAKREELARAVATAKPKLDKLEAENARLANIKGMDDAVITRRDRKIDELKAELDAERSRREQADRRAAEGEKERDQLVEHLRKELAVTREEARHSNVHADILQTSHVQLAKEYRQRIAGLHKTMRDLEAQKEEDRKRLARLDVVGGQMRGEVERMRRMHAELLNVWHRFEMTKNLEVEGMEEGARKLSVGIDEKEKEKVKLAEDMVDVLGKMKWVLNLDSLQRGAHSPPLSPEDNNPIK